ncbi:phosphatidylinositol glycan, class c, putative [Perkinsus marinus ATCC 50983]|uniref:Phosphatidylinositol glycan, class c, putative n=1 Tax=Perkinsus marinus (strain ATCC 50983 / TXsc) TaxID=423536 RepID=C5KBE5_PERM5|nr:phosphatidylinositol glycan, class c, putative [Perkinsus marinus ATCC 50983]EER18471.1 phosphatidylinositol glycan, class c, putative [Perkinsus marinus ATCC 50983]|eukprot:XP_002786675.1 phosphatidylinositol glycan, class c, putative [Perkinsus marinus ATCC 50983]
MNTNLRRYRYWPLVAKTACIAQHLSVKTARGPALGMPSKSKSIALRKAWLVDSTVGLNAAMFAAIILASRLRTPDYVFAFAFFAMLAFAFIPFAFKWVYDNSRNVYTKVREAAFCVLTPGICFLATLGLWMHSKVGAIAFQVLIALMCFACPYLLMKSQCYKTEMRGPWDIAIVGP